jgi:hypothetical protein
MYIHNLRFNASLAGIGRKGKGFFIIDKHFAKKISKRGASLPAPPPRATQRRKPACRPFLPHLFAGMKSLPTFAPHKPLAGHTNEKANRFLPDHPFTGEKIKVSLT